MRLRTRHYFTGRAATKRATATQARATLTTATLAVGLVAAVPLAAQSVTPEGDPGLGRLLAEIERLAPSSGGTVGVGAVHIETGRAVWFNEDERFPMASTYKVPIAVQLLSRVDRGEITLADMVELEPGDIHPGSGTISNLFDDPGVALSLRNLLELMLLISDNSATDLTLTAAGGPDAVNARMSELNVDGLSVNRPTSVLIGDYSGVETPADGRISMAEFRERAGEVSASEREAAREAFSTDPQDTSTPRAMAHLLAMTWAGKALGSKNTEVFKDVMLRVQTGTGRIKGVLPPGTPVGHKTGTIGGTTNDVGYIYLPDDAGHVITVVFVKDSERPVPAREATIAQISRAIYDYFLFNPGTPADPSADRANPRYGVWKLRSDAPAPALNVMTYDPWGDGGMKITVESTNARGGEAKWSYETMFDGEFRPVTGRDGVETAVEVVDRYTNRITSRRDGRVTQVIINVLSEDGNRIDNEYRSTDADGNERVSHAVYERIGR
ncbi:class A beta-lactamase [Candidatus Palauibacter sp.]|uniref:class A beta-lactamase n=1 Tax=Candidatus Palauibacter sp. TaxID=3101350 RepID=UPI003D0D535B